MMDYDFGSTTSCFLLDVTTFYGFSWLWRGVAAYRLEKQAQDDLVNLAPVYKMGAPSI